MKISIGAMIYDPLDRLSEVRELVRKYNKSLFGDLCQALRIAITGRVISPPIFEVMEILGKDECLKRLKFAII